MTKDERSAIGRALNALRKTYGGGRPKIMRKCKKCGREMGTAELRVHKCEARFRRVSAVKPNA